MNYDDKNEQQKPSGEKLTEPSDKPVNPFETNPSAEKGTVQLEEEIENEQQFKEAQTERD